MLRLIMPTANMFRGGRPHELRLRAIGASLSVRFSVSITGFSGKHFGPLMSTKERVALQSARWPQTRPRFNNLLAMTDGAA